MKPVPDADTTPHWDGIAEGELRLQRCEACGAAVFYPRAGPERRLTLEAAPQERPVKT